MLVLASQIIYSGYVSTVAFNAAAEAATVAATYDGGYQAGKARAQAVLTEMFGSAESSVTGVKITMQGRQVWRFRVRVRSQLLALGAVSISQISEALCE